MLACCGHVHRGVVISAMLDLCCRMINDSTMVKFAVTAFSCIRILRALVGMLAMIVCACVRVQNEKNLGKNFDV